MMTRQRASIREASLFDRPLDDDESDDESLEQNATLEPRIHADDASEPDSERTRSIQRRRNALLASRRRS